MSNEEIEIEMPTIKEADHEGFDKKALRELLKRRKMD